MNQWRNDDEYDAFEQRLTQMPAMLGFNIWLLMGAQNVRKAF